VSDHASLRLVDGLPSKEGIHLGAEGRQISKIKQEIERWEV